MIFLTVGTQLPFDRLVLAIDTWAGENPGHQIFGQIADPGPGGYRPKNFEWVADLSPPEFQARFDAATHIVSHAGMGTIISALNKGKPILLMPRLAHLGEHRNDHQKATVQGFRHKPGILVADGSDNIDERMAELMARQAAATTLIQATADSSLTGAIREALGLPLMENSQA